jgi:hypothetical protein
MHQCEEFRERITEHIIDREDLGGRAEFRYELMACSECAEFYAEAREMMDALSAVDLSVSETQWHGIRQRLNARIFNESVPCAKPVRTWTFSAFPGLIGAAIPTMMSAAALLLVTIGLSRLSPPAAVQQEAASEPAEAIVIERTVPLDPVTVDFLQESELLLRNVLNMESTSVEDLADARKVASEQLGELEQRKEAAAEVPPVVSVMETYETILRDLRNVDERTVSEDISDIQRRIQSNGLIANMKAFQPRVTEISFR